MSKMKVGFGLQLCQQIMLPFVKLQVHITRPPTLRPFIEWGSLVSVTLCYVASNTFKGSWSACPAKGSCPAE